jgi:hypothetical protein
MNVIPICRFLLLIILSKFLVEIGGPFVFSSVFNSLAPVC